jgi:hypothetical protein
LSHNFPPSLERFFETNNPILEIKLWGSTQGIRRTFVDANLTAFAKLPIPFHLFFLLIERPAGIGTGDIASETASALLMVNHGTNNPPV